MDAYAYGQADTLETLLAQGNSFKAIHLIAENKRRRY